MKPMLDINTPSLTAIEVEKERKYCEMCFRSCNSYDWYVKRVVSDRIAQLDLDSSTSIESVHLIESGSHTGSNLRGLQYQQVPGDGHCLFHAIGLSLGVDASFLRRIVAARMEEDRKIFHPYRGGTEEEFMAYINDIREGREWGDHIEIETIQRMMERPVIILQPNNNPIIPDNIGEYGDEVNPIFLYLEGPHYDALLVEEGFEGREILGEIQRRLVAGEMVQYQITSQIPQPTKSLPDSHYNRRPHVKLSSVSEIYIRNLFKVVDFLYGYYELSQLYFDLLEFAINVLENLTDRATFDIAKCFDQTAYIFTIAAEQTEMLQLKETYKSMARHYRNKADSSRDKKEWISPNLKMQAICEAAAKEYSRIEFISELFSLRASEYKSREKMQSISSLASAFERLDIFPDEYTTSSPPLESKDVYRDESAMEKQLLLSPFGIRQRHRVLKLPSKVNSSFTLIAGEQACVHLWGHNQTLLIETLDGKRQYKLELILLPKLDKYKSSLLPASWFGEGKEPEDMIHPAALNFFLPATLTAAIDSLPAQGKIDRRTISEISLDSSEKESVRILKSYFDFDSSRHLGIEVPFAFIEQENLSVILDKFKEINVAPGAKYKIA